MTEGLMKALLARAKSYGVKEKCVRINLEEIVMAENAFARKGGCL